jgi:hypothetical protein
MPNALTEKLFAVGAGVESTAYAPVEGLVIGATGGLPVSFGLKSSHTESPPLCWFGFVVVIVITWLPDWL